MSHSGLLAGGTSIVPAFKFVKNAAGERFIERTTFAQMVTGMKEASAKNKLSALRKTHTTFEPVHMVADADKHNDWVFKHSRGSGPCVTVLSVEAAEAIAAIWDVPKAGVPGAFMAEIGRWKTERVRGAPDMERAPKKMRTEEDVAQMVLNRVEERVPALVNAATDGLLRQAKCYQDIVRVQGRCIDAGEMNSAIVEREVASLVELADRMVESAQRGEFRMLVGQVEKNASFLRRMLAELRERAAGRKGMMEEGR